MPIADLPPGEWTPLLIGDLWPSALSLESASIGSTSRGKQASQFEHYTDVLMQIKVINIAPQEGVTAEDMRAIFDRGIANARHTAEINRVKSKSYADMYRTVSEFRSKLQTLAADGNNQINAVNLSQKPLPEKISEIVAIIAEVRGRAIADAAGCAGDINTAIQEVLTAQGIDQSAQAFAATQGIGPTAGPSASAQNLQNEVADKLNQLNNSAAGAASNLTSEPLSPNTPTATAPPGANPATPTTASPGAVPASPSSETPTATAPASATATTSSTPTPIGPPNPPTPADATSTSLASPKAPTATAPPPTAHHHHCTTATTDAVFIVHHSISVVYIAGCLLTGRGAISCIFM